MKSDLQLAAEAQRKGVWFTLDYTIKEIVSVWCVGQHGDRDAAMESAKDLMEGTLELEETVDWRLMDHDDILTLDNFNLHAIESMLKKYDEPE